MQKIITPIFALFLTLSGFAQTRYLDSSFVSVKTDSDVIYGQAEAISAPYLSESWTWVQDLTMDIYQPQGDMETVRPCILFVHGGAFLFGSKDDNSAVNVCNDMAEKGYVCVSIDYRLGLNTFSAASAERAVYRGVQDAKAAIRFLKENHATYGIDTSRIFGMGSSAGSIALIHAAYMEADERANITSSFTTPDLGCLSCGGNAFTHNDKPIVLANLWGAIVDTNFIEAGDAPMISFHGTADSVVSPDSASPFSSPFFPALSGTNYITARLENVGIYTEYYKFYGQGHEPWGVFSETPYYDTIIDQTTLFFYNYLQNNPSNTFPQNTVFNTLNIYPNPTTNILNLDLNINTKGKAKLLITNTLGQIVHAENRNMNQGENHLNLNISNLEKGWYYLTIEVDGQRINRTILKN
jgi:para-nitrobenzyl esterase